MSTESLSGWGRAAGTVATVEEPSSAEELQAALHAAGHRGVIPRGLGRSYGDAAQNGGGAVARMTSISGVLDFDPASGRVRVQAGASLDHVMRSFVPLGWFVPVSPGTRQVTVGGAIASDIHGKNHHRDGSFSRFVEELELVAPAGKMRLSPDTDPDAFWATAGGMGLTGIVTEATIRLQPIETSLMTVDTDRAGDLDQAMAMMEAGDASYRYTVAWVDCLARGAHMGRAVLTRGDHARLDQLPAGRRGNPLAFAPATRLAAPGLVPGGLVNRLSMAAFNEFWYRKAPAHREGHLESIASFFHPLDGVRDWNRMYGPRGFLQYQFAVPFGAEDVVRHAVEVFSGTGTPSFLAVLKRFGEASPGPLSFPQPGWTLTLDMPAGIPGLARRLDEMDERVAAARGRLYLAKDSRMRADMLPAMYARLDEWRTVQARLDPSGVMQSDLSRRLRLTGER